MQHTVEKTDEGARINVIAAPEQQSLILQEFAKCSAGTCSCPTPQYEKLESMDVAAQASGVTVNLKVKAGQTIDVADIEHCLDHTAQQIGEPLQPGAG